MTIPPVQQGHAAARSAARESGAGRATAPEMTDRFAASFAAGAPCRTPARTG
ncbi:hypothetical protein [Caballeronia sp. BCC1704]|uniref:hypothetical protein n=1 Tax=Caballeronia sp. BCC1704 TaxID=2676300 RepID=UPI00158B3CBB|nr:hypothetical protein [Caballeronia sp. BCC1704]